MQDFLLRKMLLPTTVRDQHDREERLSLLVGENTNQGWKTFQKFETFGKLSVAERAVFLVGENTNQG